MFRLPRRNLLNPKNSHASPTPIVEGDRVYVHFGADGTAALTSSGEVVWRKRFPYESQHGNGGSPTLYKDLLIFSCDGSDTAFVVALDKRTGAERWKTHRRHAGRPGVLDAARDPRRRPRSTGQRRRLPRRRLRSRYRAARSGASATRDGFSNVPRPVFANGLVYIATGFQEPSLIAVRPDGTGDVTRTHMAWTLRRSAPHTPSPLAVGDELYVVSDIGIATCLDGRTGETLWRERLGGNYSASPVFADGRIYFLSEEGVATVLAPGKTFRKLATNTLDGSTLASMAIADRSIFIRTDSALYRLGRAE